MKHIYILIILLAGTFCTLCAAQSFDPVVKQLEGFEVHIDPALLEDDEGKRIIKMLDARLMMIVTLVPEPALSKLRTCPIWIEKHNSKLGAMQFHPDARWLKRNGHDSRLEKMVHIPRAAALLSRGQMVKHPWVVLHELAHAYHNRILGFDDPDIKKAYAAAKASGKYDQVMSYTGRKNIRHYAMTTPMEYFAENTEAYFAQNDFYPFVRAELKEHDPEMYAILERVWGKL